MEKLMKTLKYGIRSTVVRVIAIVFFLTGVQPDVKAQNNPNADIKYIGIVEDKLVFQVDYPNEGKEPFTVEIKDQHGYRFFFEKYREKNFSKKFAIDKAELGKNAISFVVASRNQVQSQVFDVNASFRVVEEVSVVKL